MSSFKPAQRSPYQRVALVGPSGSGKTWSALALAQGKTALISLEGPPPQPVDWQPATDLSSLLAGLKAAREGGYASVILDCLSSVWNGPKGLLTLLDRYEERKAWALIRQDLEVLFDALASYPGHVFATFRAEELKVIQEREGQHRVVSLPGKVAFQGDVGSHFDVLLELSGGVADCKKGPPAAYGKLFPFPGAELAGLLFPPASASQASPPAAEAVLPPQEADPETPAHPLEPGQPVASLPLRGGISIQSSEPRLNGQSDEAEIDLASLHRKAVAVYRQGVSSADVRHILTSNGGEFDEAGKLQSMPPDRRAYAYGQLENARSLAKKEA